MLLILSVLEQKKDIRGETMTSNYYEDMLPSEFLLKLKANFRI